MGYVNTEGAARVFVQTGMDNTRQDAGVSARALSQVLGGVSTGYITNGTEGIAADVGEYLPNTLGKKDILNEYTYRTLNAQGPTLIATHSAGNEDARKALQAAALYGHQYSNLSFISLGSPVSGSVMRQSVTGAGAAFLGQVNDWRDPVTYSKTAGAVAIASAATGLGTGIWAGATYWAGIGSGAGLMGAIFGGVVGGAAGNCVGAIPAFFCLYGFRTYHSFQQYIAKPQSQSIMFDWLRKQSPAPSGRGD